MGNNYLSEMKAVNNEVLGLTEASGLRPSPGTGLSGFWKRTRFSLKLFFLEKK